MSEIYRIIPYGSCRVFEPILLLKKMGLIKSTELLGKWYTHTSKEVIQKKKILDCQESITHETFPLMMADHHNIEKVSDDIQKRFSKKRVNWYTKPADVIVIEISSLKKVCLPHNKFGQIGAYNILKNNTPSHMNSLSSTLKAINIEEQNITELYDDIISIIDMFKDKKIIFVSHINIKNFETDQTIPAREKICLTLKKFEQYDNVNFFDPTSIVENLGYNNCMLNSTHYREVFFPVISLELSKIMLPNIDNTLVNMSNFFISVAHNNFEEAINIAQSIIDILPSEIRKKYLLYLSECYEKINDYKNATSVYKEYVYGNKCINMLP